MWGVLDLTWKPSSTSSAPAAGQSAAIVRGDTYAHVITFMDGEDPFPIVGDVTAQVRTARLTGSTAADPLADFAVLVASNVVTISLTPAQTVGLPAAAYWDLQTDDGGTITTQLAGKVKVLDDVTRETA